MTSAEQFHMPRQYKEWFEENGAQVVGDNDELHKLADELGATVSDEPQVSVGPLPLRSNESQLYVGWLPPAEPLMLPDHQIELTRAVGKALLEAEHETRRHRINRRSILAFAGGAGVAGVGELLLHNDAVRYGGWGIAAVGCVALAIVNSRDTPDAPELNDDIHPIRIERAET